MFIIYDLMQIGLFYMKINLFNILWYCYSCWFWWYNLTHTGTNLSRAFQKLSQLSKSELCSLRWVYSRIRPWKHQFRLRPHSSVSHLRLLRERMLTVYFVPNCLVHDSGRAIPLSSTWGAICLCYLPWV